MDDLFIGSAICDVGGGGEIALPLALNQTIRSKARSGALLLGLHEDWSCLVIYDQSFAVQQQGESDARRASLIGQNLEAHHARMRRTFGFVERLCVTPDGIVIDGMVRERGRIGASALLVGTGHRLEIWDLDTVVARGPSDLMTLASLHLKIRLKEGQKNVPALQPVGPRRCATIAPKPRISLQSLRTVQPRHDPVGNGTHE